MNHVAIDLGSKESQVCIRQSDGTLVREFKHPTKRLGPLMASWGPSRVILETSSEAFAVADQALAAKHEVRVVPATLVKTLGVGARGIKTDQRDARVLSEVSCRIDLPSVHIPSTMARELKAICSSRESMVDARTQLVNNVRGWMRTELWQVRSGAPATFAARLRARAMADARVLPEHISRELVVIETLTAQLREADRQMKQLANQHPACRRLMTVPGVGSVTAVRFVAALDDASRFRSGHAVAAYLGLTPGEHSSADRQQRTGITKAGPRAVRRVLVQAAWVHWRSAPDQAMARWADQVALRRGKFVAVVALARKLAGVLFALWRDGTTFQANRGVPLAA